jgi:hypothetical protein
LFHSFCCHEYNQNAPEEDAPVNDQAVSDVSLSTSQYNHFTAKGYKHSTTNSHITA